jgi:hypothetical protein
MGRQAIIGALLLIGVGIALGATMFRFDIAQATGLAESVTVDNTAAQAVPVREQDLDRGNIRVHEEGTANIQGAVGISSFPTATQIRQGGGRLHPNQNPLERFATIIASTLVASADEGDVRAAFAYDDNGVVSVDVKSGETVAIPLLQGVAINEVGLACNPVSSGCVVEYSVIGSRRLRVARGRP